MERGDPHGVATFFSPDTLQSGATQLLGEDVARHMRVRRLDVGAPVQLVDGVGGRALATLRRLAKASASVEVGDVKSVDPLPAVHLLVPIADRDRMMWLAEKATELGATSWRPVLWRRSKSVSPRGEGAGFQTKVHARMIAALEQSAGAWLPAMFPEATVERALAAAPEGDRLLLASDGEPMLARATEAPLVIAVGPEGGLEDDERARFVSAGFRIVSLGSTVLRFETAAVAALGVARASLSLGAERTHG